MDIDLMIKEFISIWVVVDPIGSIPVFIAVTAHLHVSMRRKIAFKSVFIAAAVLLFFIIAGQHLLEALSIPLAAFQIAGGIVLFLFALTMIFGDGKPDDEKKQIHDNDAIHLAVFPLAVPSLASPGAMLAVVMLTDNHRYSLEEQLITAGVTALVLLITLVLFLLASPIQRIIGDSGASIVSRVMGLILASVAVDNVLRALSSYFNLA